MAIQGITPSIEAGVVRLLQELIGEASPLSRDTDLNTDLRIDVQTELPELTRRLSQAFAIALLPENLQKWRTVGRVCEHIEQRISADMEEAR